MTAEALIQISYVSKDSWFLIGVERLLRRSTELYVSNVTRPTVQKYLRSEQAYKLHKPAPRWFTINHIYVAEIDAQLQADLAETQAIARQNGAMRYHFIVIDIFVKFAWTVPVYSNYAKAITAAVGYVFITANPSHPRHLQTDKGKEFFNLDFQTMMMRHGIQHFASESKQMAEVERFNRTITTRIWTYLSDRGTLLLVDVIQDLVDGFNNSCLRSLGMALADVQHINENRRLVRLFRDGDSYLTPQIPQAAMVRANSHITIFDKCYMPNISKEHVSVSQPLLLRKGTKRRVYKLVDYSDKAVKGSLYPEKLQKIFNN